MRTDREKANIMRHSGMTYSEIKAKLGISKSTLSDWFRGQEWSNDIAREAVRKASHFGAMRLVVLNTVRGGRLKRLYEEARQDALGDFNELKYHPLFISGVMTYWAHGDKSSKNRVLVTSSDPNIIKIAKLFLENICMVKQLKTWLLIDPKIPESICRAHWISKCGLKYGQFGKNILVRHKRQSKRLHYGVCNIGTSSAYLKRKIMKWIELMVEEIGEEKYLIIE
jgi:hypothetical protein